MKRFVFSLTLAVLAISFAWAPGAHAATNVTTCQTLSVPGDYFLQNDVFACATDCFIIAADRVTLDLRSHNVYQFCSEPGTAGVTDNGTPRNNITIKNLGGGGVISLFDHGIDLAASTRSSVLAVNTNVNATGGMKVGDRSLVKNCTVNDNGHVGITIGDFGQVEGCTLSGNGFDAGIKGGDHMLVTRTTVTNTNLGTGIVVGDFCTISYSESSSNGIAGIQTGDRCNVTHNTANGNGIGTCPFGGNEDCNGMSVGGSSSVVGNTENGNTDEGMEVGPNSTVTSNTANDNGEEGIEVDCPSTVTNNHSNTGYDLEGSGCFSKNNL